MTTPDKGPWTVGKLTMHIHSDDFKHDVSLKVIGDFADDDERMEYTQWLCDVLNRAAKEER